MVFSSKTYKWNTPRDAFDELNEEFHFDFDPNYPPMVGNFEGNCLREKWHGRVYANFPYDKKLLFRMIKRAWTQLVQGNVEIVVMLLPSRTGSPWFHYLLERGAEFRINRGRLKFGDSENGAPFDTCVAILTQDNVRSYHTK